MLRGSGVDDAWEKAKENLKPDIDTERSVDPERSDETEESTSRGCINCESEEEAMMDVVTGLDAFATPRGLMEFTIGIMNGTSLIIHDEDMVTCSDSIVIEIIENA